MDKSFPQPSDFITRNREFISHNCDIKVAIASSCLIQSRDDICASCYSTAGAHAWVWMSDAAQETPLSALKGAGALSAHGATASKHSTYTQTQLFNVYLSRKDTIRQRTPARKSSSHQPLRERRNSLGEKPLPSPAARDSFTRINDDLPRAIPT